MDKNGHLHVVQYIIAIMAHVFMSGTLRYTVQYVSALSHHIGISL